MPQSMQVVRGLLAANPDYWPAKTNADGTTSSAYLRATVYEDRPRVRQKDGSYTDNPLGPVRTTVKFWGQAAELLHGMDFRQGDAVVATGRMGDPDAFISQKDGGFPKNRTKERDALRFSAGERVRFSLCVLRKPDRGKQALGFFVGERLSRDRCGEPEILKDGEIGHEHGLLENAADLFRTEITFLFLRHLCDVLPIYHDLARCRREQAAHRMEKRRFPAPRGADQRPWCIRKTCIGKIQRTDSPRAIRIFTNKVSDFDHDGAFQE